MRLLTTNFRNLMAERLVQDMSDSSVAYYVTAHRSVPYDNDLSPPAPESSMTATHDELYDELVFGKRITEADVRYMVRNVPWMADTVYAMYDHADSGLESKNFYVASYESGSYHVFKCLNNNHGAPSTDQPLFSEVHPNDEFYRKSDGYEWKYMYSVNTTEYTKFATTEYLPVNFNAAVVNAAVSGSVDSIVIESQGANYKSYAVGNIKEPSVSGNNLVYAIESSLMTLSSNNSFYDGCSLYIDSGPGDGEIRTIRSYFSAGGERRVILDAPFITEPSISSTFKIAPRVYIWGDGDGARARAEVDPATGSISDVILVDRGRRYTFANVTITGNTGIVGAETTTSAVIRPIVSPPGGHGSDPVNELYASRVGVGMSFENSENQTIPVSNDYRKIGIIRAPTFARVGLTMNVAAGSFAAGEQVSQPSTGAVGTVVDRSANVVFLSDISGVFSTNQTVQGLTSTFNATPVSIDRGFNTFDQRQTYEIDLIDGTGFLQDETVIQEGQSSLQDVAKVELTTSAYAFFDGETVTQPETGVSGIVTARYKNTLDLKSVNGYFSAGFAVSGALSGRSSIVVSYDTAFMAQATGKVHQANTTSVSLVDVGGTFLLSDSTQSTINTIKGEASQTIASIHTPRTTQTSLVDGSGEFIYVENFVPVTRGVAQAERVKIIIEF